MRNIQIKDNGLTIGKESATIKLEWHNKGVPEKQLKALAILLGAYNKYGRSIDLNVHRKRIEQFTDLLNEIQEEI